MNWRHLKTTAVVTAIALSSTTAIAAQRYTLGTNPQGSIYYTIGGGIAAALQKNLNQQVTVQPFTGSSVYIPLIGAGEVTMGLNSSLDLGAWYNGEYSEPMKNLRVLARIWPLTVGYVTRAEAGLINMSDLKGKRVVTDFSALKAMSKLNTTMLELSGVKIDELTAVTTASLGSGMSELTENAIDATLIAVGIPLTQQAHASIPGGIRYLNIDGENATTEKADAIYPGMYLTEIKPSKRTPEVTEPITVARFDVFLTVNADLPDADATALLTALYESLPQLKKDYPPLGGAALEKLSQPSNTVPYHPASVEFFKSHNMWSDVNMTRDEPMMK